MANLRLANATRDAMLAAILALLDAGAGPAVIEIYDGTQPATPNTAITTQNLLATITFSNPAAAAPSGGALTFDAFTRDEEADDTGTAAWARIKDSDDNPVFDCDVGGPGSGATIELNTTSLVAGGPVEINSGVINMPVG